MSPTAATVRPYNPTKKLSGSNYQAMPYHDGDGGGTGAAVPQSPASTWKESAGAAAQQGPSSESRRRRKRDDASGNDAKALSGLSAQLLSHDDDDGNHHHALHEGDPPPPVDDTADTRFSMRDMFGSTDELPRDGDDDDVDFYQEDVEEEEDTPKAKKNLQTPPSSLGGTLAMRPQRTPPTTTTTDDDAPSSRSTAAGETTTTTLFVGATAKMIGPASPAAVSNHENTTTVATGGATDPWSGRKYRYGRPGPGVVLYSAIGSLEDPSNQSFQQSLWSDTNAVTARYEALRNGSTRQQQQQPFLIPPPVQMTKNKVSGNEKNGSNKSGMSELLLGAASATPAAETSAATAAVSQDPDTDSKPRAKSLSPEDAGATTTAAAAEKNMELNQQTVKASNLRLPGQQSKRDDDDADNNNNQKKSVKIAPDTATLGRRKVARRRQAQPAEQFRPSSDAYTPRMGKKEIKYKPAEKRTPVQRMSSGLGTLSRPNFRDALRRVAMILRQHIVKIERRFESHMTTSSMITDKKRRNDSLFVQSMKDEFSEDRFATPTYKVTMVRVPMARGGMVGGLKKVRQKHEIPSESEIYEFAHRLFKTVQLSSECSIVCLIYIERLMEVAKVPLLASTWRPIVMCGLLLASKVWQDLSSWNIEFATVYPQYSLDAIHRLELQFLRMVKWDLYISSTLYAKYYFALRALVSKQDFRQRYNRMVGGVDSVQAAEARKIEERSTLVKEEALQQLSRSM